MAEGIVERRTFSAGHHVFRENETGDLAFVVDSGTVEIIKATDGEPLVLAEVSKGGMFGEMALIDGSQRMASARCKDNCVLIVVTREMIDRKLESTDPFIRGLLKVLSDHVRQMGTTLVTNG